MIAEKILYILHRHDYIEKLLGAPLLMREYLFNYLNTIITIEGTATLRNLHAKRAMSIQKIHESCGGPANNFVYVRIQNV